jgi:hypothetical protein
VRSDAPLAARPGVPAKVSDLERALQHAWSADTSACHTWSLECPSAGQCAVTALLVQDFFGGELLRGVVCGESHYWNRLPAGIEVDLTAQQFAEYRLDGPPGVRDRSYVLSFPDTARRYHLLRAAVASLLHDPAAARSPRRG